MGLAFFAYSPPFSPLLFLFFEVRNFASQKFRLTRDTQPGNGIVIISGKLTILPDMQLTERIVIISGAKCLQKSQIWKRKSQAQCEIRLHTLHRCRFYEDLNVKPPRTESKFPPHCGVLGGG